jgi:hypothetical protein
MFNRRYFSVERGVNLINSSASVILDARIIAHNDHNMHDAYFSLVIAGCQKLHAVVRFNK